MRSSVPLSHKLFAVIVAVATACGLYAFLRYRHAQFASAAALSFDSAAAQRLYSGIKLVPQPAVVFGQSVLNDTVVARFVPQADRAASSTAITIGEFRTRLELTQPNAGLLLVHYRDSDPGQAVAIANEVAEGLAAWTPSIAGTHAPAADALPAPTPILKPQLASNVSQDTLPAGPSLAAALAELKAQLSSADQRVSQESSLQSAHDRQRFLESQVRAAQQKLGDLRREFVHSGSNRGAQARLDTIQHALAVFWPSAAGLNTAGTSEAQLRYEREQFNRDIGIVEQERQATRREEAANSAPVRPLARQTAPANSQSQPAKPADTPSPLASGAAVNPLQLERMAGIPEPVAWWPSALVGCICGLLYWGLAFTNYRSRSDPDDMSGLDEESAPYRYRLFEDDPPGPDMSSSPEAIHASNTDTSLESLPETRMAPSQGLMAETASSVNALDSLLSPDEQDDVLHGKLVERGDPWGDKIRENLSQTAVGRALDAPISREESTEPKGPSREAPLPASQTHRRTG